jgi:hypothetical protein
VSAGVKVWARPGAVYCACGPMPATTPDGLKTATMTCEYSPVGAAKLGFSLIGHAFLAWAFGHEGGEA